MTTLLKRLGIILLAISSTVACHRALNPTPNEVGMLYENKKTRIEQAARNGQINWVTAETEVSTIHQELSKQYPRQWPFGSIDQAYYDTCINLASELDQGSISYLQFDAKRIRALELLNKKTTPSSPLP